MLLELITGGFYAEPQETEVVAEDVAIFDSLRPTATNAPGVIATQDGTVQAAGLPMNESDAFTQPGLFPSVATQVVSTGFQGEVKKVEVELASLRWDPGAGRLVLAKRLVVRLEFKAREAAEVILPTACG